MMLSALDLAGKGYYVHPCCWPDADGQCGCGRGHKGNEVGKAPLTPHGVSDATTDPASIRDWWSRWPQANIGIHTARSGVVDVASDCPEWAATFRDRGMPPTALYTSGGGRGHWHALYRRPKGTPTRNINKPGAYDILAAGNAIAPGSAHRSGRTYTLLTDLPDVRNLPEAPAWVVEELSAVTTPTESTPIDLAAIETRRGNIGVIQARVMKTLPAIARAALEHPDDCLSYSEARFRVIGGMMQLPDDEIAAMVHFWGDEGTLPWGHLEGKSIADRNHDIESCITKHTARLAKRGYTRNPQPTRGAGLLPARPLTKPRARDDRPRKIDAPRLFAYYQEQASSGVVLMTIRQVAEAFRVCGRTIARIEHQLEKSNLIERKARQHQSFVRILRAARYDNIAAVSPLESADLPAPDAEKSDSPALYNHTSSVGAESVGWDSPGELVPPEAVTPEKPTVAGVIRACFDSGGVLDVTTGELRKLTKKRVGQAVRDAGLDCSPATLDRSIRAERKRRQAAAWAEERAKVAELKDRALLKTVAARQRTLARAIGKPREGYHRVRLAIADEVRARRGLVMPGEAAPPIPQRPTPAGKKNVLLQTTLDMPQATMPRANPILVIGTDWAYTEQAHQMFTTMLQAIQSRAESGT